jgi:hypothetical protein
MSLISIPALNSYCLITKNLSAAFTFYVVSKGNGSVPIIPCFHMSSVDIPVGSYFQISNIVQSKQNWETNRIWLKFHKTNKSLIYQQMLSPIIQNVLDNTKSITSGCGCKIPRITYSRSFSILGSVFNDNLFWTSSLEEAEAFYKTTTTQITSIKKEITSTLEFSFLGMINKDKHG